MKKEQQPQPKEPQEDPYGPLTPEEMADEEFMEEWGFLFNEKGEYIGPWG